MATDYIVVAVAQSDGVREALGRLFLSPEENIWPSPDPENVTLYYANPIPGADATQVAFGPKDEFLDSTLGKTVECTMGPVTVPSAYESLEPAWFPIPDWPPEDPPPSEPPPE